MAAMKVRLWSAHLANLACGQRMVGVAFTLRYIPAREDLDHTGALDNLTDPQRVAIERVGPGEVLVIDARNEIRAGTLGAMPS